MLGRDLLLIFFRSPVSFLHGRVTTCLDGLENREGRVLQGVGISVLHGGRHQDLPLSRRFPGHAASAADRFFGPRLKQGRAGARPVVERSAGIPELLICLASDKFVERLVFISFCCEKPGQCGFRSVVKPALSKN